MSWREHFKKLSHRQTREIAALCTGAALLITVAVVLSGGTPVLSPSLNISLQKEISSQSAAVWWSTYTSYDGWPAPHFTVGGNKMCDGVNPGAFLCGWCQAPGNCPLPSYAAVYPAADPTQVMAAKVILPGKLQYPQQAQYRPYQGPTYSGSSVSVQQGQGVTLEWACQNWQAYSYSYGGTCTSYDAFDNCNGWSGGGTGQQYFYDYGPAVGIGFTAGTHVGQKTLYPTQTTTYGVYCPASGWIYNQFWTPLPKTPTMSFTVNVGAAPPPTVTITGNGQSNSITAVPGQTVNLVATFNPAGSYTGSAINDNNQNALTSQDASSPKTYDFNTPGNPAAPGSYPFTAAVQTSALGWANSYGKTFTVTVVTACPNGSGPAGACTSCNAGYHLAGGNCVADACSDPNAGNPPTCSCIYPYTGPNGGPCVLSTCSDPNAENPPTCSCKAGYSGPSGGPCVVAPPTLSSFTATPSRVAKSKATPVTFAWSGSNLPGGGCSVSGTAIAGAASPQTASITIAQPTIFTLTCGTVQKSVTIGLVPIFQEI